MRRLNPALFHGKQVGEVCVGDQGQGDPDGLRPKVTQDYVLTHPVADKPAAQNQHWAISRPLTWWGPANEGCPVRFGRLLNRGKILYRGPVDGKSPTGQHSSIGHEQSMWSVAMDVARQGRNTKRRTFQQRDVAVVPRHRWACSGGPSAGRAFFAVDECHRATTS